MPRPQKIVLGVTAVDEKELTAKTMSITGSNSSLKNITFVLIDNASKDPYKIKGGRKTNTNIISNKKNRGCFYPLKQLYDKYKDADIIGIMHNDAAIFEKDWDVKLRDMFKDKKLGAVGLYGWQKVDQYGIDHKPIGNPLEDVQAVPYRRVKKLTPAVTLDSMCIFVRREAIPWLYIKENILLRHGFDKIWCLRLLKKGYKVGVSGFSFQHKGMAAFEDPAYMAVMKKWYDARWNLDFPIESVEGMMLFEGRVMLMTEFGDELPKSI